MFGDTIEDTCNTITTKKKKKTTEKQKKLYIYTKNKTNIRYEQDVAAKTMVKISGVNIYEEVTR